jgi:hypothetical protein
MHEDDLPDPRLLLKESRFQPILIHGAGGVSDAALIDVGNPCRPAADVDVGFSHVPFVTLARQVLGLDEGHDGVSVKSGTSIEDVKIRCNDGVKLRNIVCQGGSEYRAHDIHDLSFIGSDEFLLSSCDNGTFRNHYR